MINLIVSIVALVVLVYIRLTNSKLTETQLFLEFWPVWLGIVVVVIVATIWERKLNV